MSRYRLTFIALLMTLGFGPVMLAMLLSVLVVLVGGLQMYKPEQWPWSWTWYHALAAAGFLGVIEAIDELRKAIIKGGTVAQRISPDRDCFINNEGFPLASRCSFAFLRCMFVACCAEQFVGHLSARWPNSSGSLWRMLSISWNRPTEIVESLQYASETPHTRRTDHPGAAAWVERGATSPSIARSGSAPIPNTDTRSPAYIKKREHVSALTGIGRHHDRDEAAESRLDRPACDRPGEWDHCEKLGANHRRATIDRGPLGWIARDEAADCQAPERAGQGDDCQGCGPNRRGCSSGPDRDRVIRE